MRDPNLSVKQEQTAGEWGREALPPAALSLPGLAPRAPLGHPQGGTPDFETLMEKSRWKHSQGAASCKGGTPTPPQPLGPVRGHPWPHLVGATAAPRCQSCPAAAVSSQDGDMALSGANL